MLHSEFGEVDPLHNVHFLDSDTTWYLCLKSEIEGVIGVIKIVEASRKEVLRHVRCQRG